MRCLHFWQTPPEFLFEIQQLRFTSFSLGESRRYPLYSCFVALQDTLAVAPLDERRCDASIGDVHVHLLVGGLFCYKNMKVKF